MALTESQVQRYSRHILLPGVGGRGQERLLASSVAVAFGPDGAGAAAVAATYLAAAGVGRIGWLALEAGGEGTGCEGTGGGFSFAGLMGLYGTGTGGAGGAGGMDGADNLAESIAALNPDVSLDVLDALGTDGAGDFDLLVLIGGGPQEKAAVEEVASRFEGAGKPVIRGGRRGWAGELRMDSRKFGFDESPEEEAEGPLPAAPPEGVLGSMLASAALCALLRGFDEPVGSTALARIDLSRGLFEEAVL